MSQCVPDWDLDDVLPHQYSVATATATATATAAKRAANVHNPPSDYGLSELTWRNGQLASHGLHGTAPEQRAGRPVHKRRRLPGDAAPWEKAPLENGTLEAVVDQATRALVPGAMDALVPSARVRTRKGEDRQPCLVVPETASGGAAAVGACVVSCGGRKRARHGAGEGDRSVTGSAASVGLTLDWCADGAGFTTSGSPPSASPETDNTSGGRALMAVSEGDDSCYSRRSQKDGTDEDEKRRNEKIRRSVSTKRIRAAAVHNQSERKRRDKINQRMRTLQKLVPNSSKTDKASILDEVIDYMKQLQAQVQVMNRMSSMAPPMMMPMALQQMQMAMMAQMAQMGAAMGMGMADSWQPPWAAFLPSSAPRDLPAAGRDTMQAAAAGAFLPDPFSAFLAFQPQQQQPMSATDPHSRNIAATHQQQYQQPPGPSREGAERS